MARSRVLAVGLDGLETTLAERLMADGKMPALDALRRRSVRFRLDAGAAQRTGLAWEHAASGLSPEAGRRWAAVEFDPSTYRTWQEGARFAPWWADLDLRVVVFDTPYLDLSRTRNTRGVVGWGAHDPGTPSDARPRSLLWEFDSRFGEYPASRWTYDLPWPSATRARQMGEGLARALDVRSRAAKWLAVERLPDWDFYFAVAGELHGGVEGLWHGIDPSHPLHEHASGPAAGAALVEVHRALDRMLEELVAVAGDAAVVVFNMGGMGPNNSDAPTMVLLPELLYRHAFSRSLLELPSAWTDTPEQLPILDPEDDWSRESRAWLPTPEEKRELRLLDRALAVGRRLPEPIRGVLKNARRAVSAGNGGGGRSARQSLDWQPAARYQPYWSRMPAFALPSFYDGRIRLNLRGRERDGIVAPERYEETCRELETMLRECRNPLTGEPAVESIERAWTSDPLKLTGSEADLVVIWRGIAAALVHPRLGQIGPIPLRRTGGHTGTYGMAYVAGPGLAPRDGGVRSAFDVVPTVATLLGKTLTTRVSGRSLL